MSAEQAEAARAAADAIDAQALGGAMLVSNDLLNEWAKLLRSLADDVARLTRERDALNTELDERLADIARMREEAREFQALHAEETAALKRKRDALRAALVRIEAGESEVSGLKPEFYRHGQEIARKALVPPGDGAAGGGRG
jgi:predicted  nucleic acid-binding Zn-ribbon protein